MQNKKQILGGIAILVVCISLCACTVNTAGPAKAPPVENEFNISILKVGQADAIILKTKNHTAVIDCGEKDDGDEVSEYLAEAGIDKIDYLFITHFDKDHVGGAAEVLDNLQADKIILPSYIGTSDEYEAFESKLREKQIEPMRITEEMTFTLDDTLFTVYPPQKKSYSEPDNDYSLVISVIHGENKLLFAGDAEKDRLAELPTQLDLDHDFLKMPHHGNYNKGTAAFLKSVTPTYTVICDSNKNPAEDDTIKALEAVGSEIYYTKDGSIKVISNGKTISVTQ